MYFIDRCTTLPVLAEHFVWAIETAPWLNIFGTMRLTKNSSNASAEMTTEMRVQLIQVLLVHLLHVDWYMSVASLRVTPRSMLTFLTCLGVGFGKTVG